MSLDCSVTYVPGPYPVSRHAFDPGMVALPSVARRLQLTPGVSPTRTVWVAGGAISRWRNELGAGDSLAVKKRLAYAAGVSWVARLHGATLPVGRYARSVREALSPARA